MKFINVDVERAERHYRNLVLSDYHRIRRRQHSQHWTHVSWPPEKVEQYRKVHWVKAHRKWRKQHGRS